MCYKMLCMAATIVVTPWQNIKRKTTGFNLKPSNLLIKTLREKCPYSKFFWFVFSRIRTEYGEARSISPYSL